MITINGQDIKINRLRCDGNPAPLEEMVNVSVHVTDRCNASCSFCCNSSKDSQDLDIEKFTVFIKELASKIKINRITFTGGEPFLLIPTLSQAIKIAKDSCDNVSVNTNGILIDYFIYGDCQISLSKHHYDNKINRHIFGSELIYDLSYYNYWYWTQNITPTCVLQKGLIDSEQEIINYLEYAGKCGFNKCAFYGLMNINSFCNNKVVDIRTLDFTDYPQIINYKNMNFPEKNTCYCRNFAYITDRGELIKFYMRQNFCSSFQKGSHIIFKNNKIVGAYNENIKRFS